MLDIALTYIAPFALTLIIGGAIRLLGGPERGARAAGVGVMISFAIAWVIFVRPGWWPVSDFTRIGHIALGAGAVGLALDLLAAKRFWAAAAAAIVLLICALASVTGKIALPDSTVAAWGGVILLALAAFLMLVRLDALKSRGVTAALLMVVALVGIATMASVAGDARLVTTALILASAVFAFGILQVVGGVPMGNSVLLGAGATLFGLAWALGHGHPETRLALLLLPLIFFAEGTANRVPLPQAGISRLLYPLVLAGLAALPVALAAFVVYVTAAP